MTKIVIVQPPVIIRSLTTGLAHYTAKGAKLLKVEEGPGVWTPSIVTDITCEQTIV